MSKFLKLKRLFKKAFLPNGYPGSVSKDYFEYQCWDSAQAFASSIMNYLATQAVFRGVGVGDANATVLAATMTWILKDGTSIIGSLIFATMQCTQMDSNCKMWRLFADLINDAAIMIDLTSPLWPKYCFTLLQCCSGVLRSLVGIAGGATRAALTQHQAKRNNMADVSAKDQSQERIVNLFSLVFSLLIIPLISDQSKLVWLIFITFTILHVYFNYRAVRAVQIEVFNSKRLSIFLDNYFSKRFNKLSVREVNQSENVWFFLSRKDDLTFKSVRFITQKPKLKSRLILERKELLIFKVDGPLIGSGEFQVSIPPEESARRSRLMIEALCWIFFYIRTENLSFNLINFEEIERTMINNGWNLNHVLMAELMADDYEEQGKKIK